jgi:hypothetical protein
MLREWEGLLPKYSSQGFRFRQSGSAFGGKKISVAVTYRLSYDVFVYPAFGGKHTTD